MNPDTIFSVANTAILLFWGLLIFLPHHRISQWAVHSPWVFLVLAVTYSAISLPTFLFGGMPEGGGFGSLEEVMVLFGSKEAVVAGWLHYLAFDLFVGTWEVRDARRLGINHLIVIPCLLLTLMFGPLGLGIYLLIRLASKRRMTLTETSA